MKRISFLAIACIALSVSAAAQDWAKQNLAKSSRHQEWVQIKHGDRTVSAFIVYPERKDKAPAIVVIHEIFGLSDWAQSMADQLAAAGYVAIAPDLLSGMAPNGGRTKDFVDASGNPDGSAVREAFSKLPPEQVTADLTATADYVRKLPASNGKVAVGGFCWGGSQTFRFAASGYDVSAAFVFYGSGPDDVSKTKAPVYGFYAGNDARVDATIPKSEELMKAAGKKYEPVTYEGAGHGFMRAGEAPEPPADADAAAKTAYAANKKAREEAWKRWMDLMKKI